MSLRVQRAAGSGQRAAKYRSAPASRTLFVCLTLVVCCLLAVAGCRQRMAETGRAKPLDRSDFFEDGRLARPLSPGTVPRGQLRADAPFYTGKMNGALLEELPVPLGKDLMARGQERYEIFCTPCHGRVGTGEGAAVKRGMRMPPSYHIPRLREAPIGHFFDVVTNGFGVMLGYAEQIPPADRWAIAAYVRALQVSQGIPVAELTPEERAQLDRTR